VQSIAPLAACPAPLGVVLPRLEPMTAPLRPALAHAARGEGIDWRTVLMLPPRRRFTAEELRRAVPERMSPTLKLSVLLNVALPVGLLLVVFGSRNPLHYSLAIVLVIGVIVAAGLVAWRDPTGRVARIAPWLVPLAAGAWVGWLARSELIDRVGISAMAVLVAMASLGLWLVIVHRYQYVEMRLAELAERERAVEMARRLAAAQLEPHFLFNTLASLQHWVQTGDERAAPLLHALTGYLRATLPMFARPTLPLRDELEAVRRYLEVMQARLGARLSFDIEVTPELETLQVPPGLLLTLAENAVEHGVEPQIVGGAVRIEGHADGPMAVIEVIDDGPGIAPGRTEGIGLANSRQRLALTHGPAARLTVANGEGGGCRATLRLPRGAQP
jgi:signal transduction histidine kinase